MNIISKYKKEAEGKTCINVDKIDIDEAMESCKIPAPDSNASKTNSSGFIRWGHNSEYFMKREGNRLTLGTWKGESFVIFEKGEKPLSKVEEEKIQEELQKKQLQEKNKLIEQYAQKALEVQALLKQSHDVQENHPYLRMKGLTKILLPADIKQDRNGNLLIPLHDSKGVIHSCQYINSKGNKRFYLDADMKGCFYTIPCLLGKPSFIALCEGFATGLSLSTCLREEADIRVSFGATRLLTVAKTTRKDYPDKTLVIFADNDVSKNHEGKPYNPGLEKAREVTKEIQRSIMIYPSLLFGESTDFNDVYGLVGRETMKEKIDEALRKGSKEVEVVFKKGETYE